MHNCIYCHLHRTIIARRFLHHFSFIWTISSNMPIATSKRTYGMETFVFHIIPITIKHETPLECLNQFQQHPCNATIEHVWHFEIHLNWSIDKPLSGWYIVWVFVSFSMHFFDRTYIWTLVLYCKSTTAQLSGRVRNCTNLWRFENSTLDNGCGPLTTIVVISITIVKW